MMLHGVQGFLADMTRLGFDPEVEANLVVYRLIPVDGSLAGTEIETGVSVDELGSWPQVPPHWVHLPGSVSFPGANSQGSPKSGWLMHSRDLRGWGDSPPAVCWSSHVRGVLSEAKE